jgi:hypothetical protein
MTDDGTTNHTNLMEGTPMEARNTEAAQLAGQIFAAYKAAARSDNREICSSNSDIYSGLQRSLVATIALAYGLDLHWADQVYDLALDDSGEGLGYWVSVLFDISSSDAMGRIEQMATYALDHFDTTCLHQVRHAASPRTVNPFTITREEADGKRKPAVVMNWGMIRPLVKGYLDYCVADYVGRSYAAPDALVAEAASWADGELATLSYLV